MSSFIGDIKMKGIWGKILRVDLTDAKCSTEELPIEVYESFLGGAGLVAYTL